MKKMLARRYYRLGLAAAEDCCLGLALQYAECASIMDPQDDAAAHLAKICRHELGVDIEQIPEQVIDLIKKKSWAKAARLMADVPHRNVRFLAMQGSLWALAKRQTKAANCFQRVLAKDRLNRVALEALKELNVQRKLFWRFF
ncbi:hypothetical protein FACS189494_04410 [Spirochaetia bacterium]|nr:hypothetical protein FACS189494_04410 [Spirochaetia bacterium]